MQGRGGRQLIAADVRRVVAERNIVGVVDLHEKAAGLRGNLEEAVLQVAMFRGILSEIVPKMWHRGRYICERCVRTNARFVCD